MSMSMSPSHRTPLTLADLHFLPSSSLSSQSSQSTLLKSLKKKHLTLTNRLSSIEFDARFVRKVAEANPHWPLVANERAGSWYVPPEIRGVEGVRGRGGEDEVKVEDDEMEDEEEAGVTGRSGGVEADGSGSGRKPDGSGDGSWNREESQRGEEGGAGMGSGGGSGSASASGSVYFKSTDGHHGEWKFSLRRLNLHLLPLIAECGGCIIIDSTRRGKLMPDALSKTIPIWAAVLNRTLFPERTEAHALQVPQDAVGASERAQIEDRIEGWVRDLKTLSLPISSLRATLAKPLNLSFLTHSTSISTSSLTVPPNPHYHTIICCTSSRRERGDGDSYVQGAGDDTENWAHGLTAAMFWRYHEDLVVRGVERGVGEEELRGLVEIIVEREKESRVGNGESGEGRKGVGEICEVWAGGGELGFWIGAEDVIEGGDRSLAEKFDAVVVCGGASNGERELRGERRNESMQEMVSGNELVDERRIDPAQENGDGEVEKRQVEEKESIGTSKEKLGTPKILQLGCPAGKIGAKKFREKIPLLRPFLADVVSRSPRPKILFLCPSGRDLSVGVALVFSCLYIDEQGNLTQGPREQIDKTFIRQRLAQITVAIPTANPSRATLQAVNTILIDYSQQPG